jgi:hypothetical protein
LNLFSLIKKCPYDNCNKKYGSAVSLNLHIKLKHNGGNKTEREKLAVYFLINSIININFFAAISIHIIIEWRKYARYVFEFTSWLS